MSFGRQICGGVLEYELRFKGIIDQLILETVGQRHIVIPKWVSDELSPRDCESIRKALQQRRDEEIANGTWTEVMHPTVLAAREQVRKNNLRRWPWLRVIKMPDVQ